MSNRIPFNVSLSVDEAYPAIFLAYVLLAVSDVRSVCPLFPLASPPPPPPCVFFA